VFCAVVVIVDEATDFYIEDIRINCENEAVLENVDFNGV